ncbi:MAG: hypothetical protein ACLQVY_29035 [Limisphaerales bacterium]
MNEFKFECIHCGQHLKCDEQFSGQQITCPTCQGLVVVPTAPGNVAVMQKTGMTFVPESWLSQPSGGSPPASAPANLDS